MYPNFQITILFHPLPLLEQGLSNFVLWKLLGVLHNNEKTIIEVQISYFLAIKTIHVHYINKYLLKQDIQTVFCEIFKLKCFVT